MQSKPDSHRTSRVPACVDAAILQEGVDRAIRHLHECSTPAGFVAAPRDIYNYREIWARDGVIIGLAGLLTEDRQLHETLEKSLKGLAAHAGPNGEIPSHFDPQAGTVSYGGSAGRVDADLWFVIGCHEFWRRTGDEAFLREMLPVCDRVRALLHAWEFNDRGLIYVPQTGDWADEFIHNGYVLYDEVLYYYAQRALSNMFAAVQDHRAQTMLKRAERLAALIRDNYWIAHEQEPPEHAYDHSVYRRAARRVRQHGADYWLSSFSPYGYNLQFDALANALVSLLGLSAAERSRCVDEYIESALMTEPICLLPSFWPVVTREDARWSELSADYSFEFKNAPYHYQNGGRWPMITGFYVADLARRGRTDRALRFLEGIHQANKRSTTSEPWGFHEYLIGNTLEPAGTPHQGWSAAGALIGHYALQGELPFHDLI